MRVNLANGNQVKVVESEDGNKITLVTHDGEEHTADRMEYSERKESYALYNDGEMDGVIDDERVDVIIEK